MDVKYNENFIAAWHTGGWVLTCGVPHVYVLLSIKLTSVVPFLCTATNIYGTCTSVCGPPAVHWIARAEYSVLSSLIGPSGFIARPIFQILFYTNSWPLMKFTTRLFLLLMKQTSENCTFACRHEKIWTSSHGTHFWWHCHFKSAAYLVYSRKSVESFCVSY